MYGKNKNFFFTLIPGKVVIVYFFAVRSCVIPQAGPGLAAVFFFAHVFVLVRSLQSCRAHCTRCGTLELGRFCTLGLLAAFSWWFAHPNLALGGVQLPLSALQWSEWTERT